MESPCQGRWQSVDAFAGLARLAADRRKPRVTIAEIVEALGTSNTLMLTLLFALPNAFPMLPRP
jgi:hypothetical protein